MVIAIHYFPVPVQKILNKIGLDTIPTRDMEAKARKFHRFHFHIEGKNGGRKEIGSAILRRRANRESINIKK